MAVVALIVIGPEKLPKVARTVGTFMGRLQRYIADVKDEISREARFEDLKKLQKEIRAGAQGVESSIMAGIDAMVDKPALDAEKPKKAVRKTKATNKKTAAKKATLKKDTITKSTAKKPRVKPPAPKAAKAKATS